MDIYELNKRITPGHMSVHHCQEHLCLRTGPGRPVREHKYVAHMTHGDLGREDARMLAHCWNNFGMALTEIHRLRDMLIAQRKDAGWPIDDLEYDNKLIKELETVNP